MKKFMVLALVIFFTFNANAQKTDKDHKDRWEKYRSEKIAFLTTYLDLSPEEAQKFWPLYNQLENERWDAQKLRKEMEGKVLEAKENLPDHKIRQLTREFAASMKKEADMLVVYNEKFLEILPANKVLTLYKGESEFKMHMFKKFRDRHKEQ
jgi:hypothetical protein